MDTTTTTTTTTAMVVWNAAVEADVREKISRGMSVKKEVAKAAPKNFISTLRSERRNLMIGQTARIFGEMQQENAKVTNSRAEYVHKNGNRSQWFQVTKFAATPEAKLEKANAEISALREQLNKLMVGSLTTK